MLRKVFALIVMGILIAGCGRLGAVAPTPFPTAGPTATTAAGGPVVLSVTELLAAPGLYLDTVVQMTGRLRKMPLVVCDSDYYPSPAGWGLGEEGLTAAAGGFDEQVRSLLPGDLTMTVEGRWRRWEGTVGCGKQAQRQEVWYLSVDRILAPSPLTQITLTPSSGVEVSAITVEPTEPFVGGGDEDEFPETPTELPEAYPGALPPTAGEDPDLLPVFPTAQTPITGQTPITETTPIAGQTVTGTLPAGTTTPSGTGTPGATSSPGATGSPGSLVDKGNVYESIGDNFTTSSLAAGTTDRWEVELIEDEELYLYAIAPQPADIILSVHKDGQALINNQNTAPAGAPEVLNAPTLAGAGLYEIHIATSGGVATEYGFTIFSNPDFPVTIGGILTPGAPRTGMRLPEGTIQFWFFMAEAGDVVAIRLKPVGDSDAAADLYGPGGVYISTIDSGYEGEEEYREVTLSETGLHAIRVFEYYVVEPMTFDLEISFP